MRRYVHLAWALWERRQGNPQHCLALLRRGCELNPTDPALYQVRARIRACVRLCACRALRQWGGTCKNWWFL